MNLVIMRNLYGVNGTPITISWIRALAINKDTATGALYKLDGFYIEAAECWLRNYFEIKTLSEFLWRFLEQISTLFSRCNHLGEFI
jgi:hypothetical protein